MVRPAIDSTSPPDRASVNGQNAPRATSNFNRNSSLSAPEEIYKLQPDRCLALRGFDSFASAAALHNATPNSFQVSGTFRDPADFAVLVLYDADNYFEHPSIKYLPDFDFTGLVLTFDLQYSDGVQPVDSPRYNWIDWATLDCSLAPGQSRAQARVRLWDYATLTAGSFTPASGTFTLTAGPSGPQPGDQLTIWFENIAFSYTAPPVTSTVQYEFFSAGQGAVHSITINGRQYSHTEGIESGADQANALIALINAGAGDPDVGASGGSVSNAVLLTARASAPDATILIQASDGNAPATLGVLSLASAATAIAAAVNAFPSPWQTSGGGLAVIATSSGANILFQAARYGFANTTGATVNWWAGPSANSWSDKFPGLLPGDPIYLNGVAFTVAAVVSPLQLTLTEAPQQDLQGASFLAPRGGRDGNFFTLYSVAEPPAGATTVNLNTTTPTLSLTGGDSTATWNISLDFTALQIDQLRQCWLTFAPSLVNGAALSHTEWLATFTNWGVTGGANLFLKTAGPGSVRIEENSGFCTYQGSGWSAPPGDVTGGFYSKYAAMVSKNAGDSVTIPYSCSLTHNLYIGTSLYSDRGTAAVVLDGVTLTPLNCNLQADSAIVTRRILASAVAAGSHSVTITSTGSGPIYFDFLEAAVLSDWSPASNIFQKISPALDYDTDHTYKLSPARIMWIFDQLGFHGPVNEYMGVFWWNQRLPIGANVQQTVVTFSGNWVSGDAIFLNINGDPAAGQPGFTMGKSVFAGDTSQTIAIHFAAYLNETSTVAWASVNSNVLTITSRSPAPDYSLVVAAYPAPILQSGSTGSVVITVTQATSTYPVWTIDPTQQPVLNRAITDWHADFYAQCASRGLEVTTAGSMELVFPPSGYAAYFPDGTPVTTATDVSTSVGLLKSTQCAVGGALVIAYQKQFYEAVAALQLAAGLTPSVQFGEFLWWFFGNPQAAPDGMAYYDAETAAAALTALGRPLQVFLTPNDDPSVNQGADATFLRNRLRDHIASIASDLRTSYPGISIEVLFPYDVNYPGPVVPGSEIGGQLNYFVNLPLEWEQQTTSGLDRIKIEALQFGTAFRSLDLANQAIDLFPNFGWPRSALRYLTPIFGTFQAWQTETGLAFSANLNAVNLWAFDHLCLYNLDFTNLREPS